MDNDTVTWAYRLLLGREPESDAAVVAHLAYSDPASLVRAMMDGLEFRSRHPDRAAHLIDKWAMIRCPQGFWLWVNLGDAAVSWAIIGDEFEPNEIAFVERHVRTGMNCLDIGANIGFFSLLMATHVGSSGTVTSFEPHPQISRYLARSAEANSAPVTVHRCALGDRTAEVKLVNSQDSPNYGASQVRFASPDDDSVSYNVSMRLLSDIELPAPINFIKIDVEGAEFLALGPFRDRLAADRPIIMSEIAPDLLQKISGVTSETYIRLIEEIGYDCLDVATDERFSGFGNRLFANVGFVPKR